MEETTAALLVAAVVTSIVLQLYGYISGTCNY